MNKIINIIWCSIYCALFFINANTQQLGADFSISNFLVNVISVTLNKGFSYTLNNLFTTSHHITNSITPYIGSSTTGYTISSNTATHPTILLSILGIYTIKLDVLTYRNAHLCETAMATKGKTAFINVTSTPNTSATYNEITIPSINGTYTICTALTATVNEASTFQWYKDDNAILGANITTYIPTEAGIYQVITSLDTGYWVPTLASPSDKRLKKILYISVLTLLIVFKQLSTTILMM